VVKTIANSWQWKYALPIGFLVFGLCCLSRAQNAPAQSGAVNADSGQRPVQAHDNSYVIGDDDVLEISVWKEPELSKSLSVRPDGKISMPLVGELQAAGKTPMQLEHDIQQKLLTYITDPEVVVIVQTINSEKFNIMGQVNKPGSFPLTATTTVVDAIATAGGFRDFAKKKNIRILHENPDGTETRYTFNYEAFIKGKNPQSNIRLRPGDTIIVN
jgi:polysaccharide export outer membrane protein